MKLCDGLGSNDDRLAVGWINDRGGVWFVTGPTQPSAAALDANGVATWCAITGAGDGVGLLSRERDRLLINLCRKGDCPMVETVNREIAKRPILAFGCVRRECVDLDGDAVMAIGAGNEHFAIAYGVADRDGRRAEAIAIDRKGNVSPIWRGPPAGSAAAPAIAWSRGQLAIATLRDGKVVTEVVALPRVTP